MSPRWARVLRVVFVAAVLALTAPLAFAARNLGLSPARRAHVRVQLGLTTDLGAAPLFDLGRMRPGVPTSRCVTVAGHGGHSPGVELYASSKRHQLDEFLYLTVWRGSENAHSCATFRADSHGRVFTGTLSSYPRSPTRPVIDPEGLASGARRTYRFTVVLVDNTRAEGLRSSVSFYFRTGGVRSR